MMKRHRRARVVLVTLLGGALLLLSGCGPEAARVRGGDNGAQIGNSEPNDPVDLLGDTPRDERIYEFEE